ncbi:MAG: hypothetical protein ACK5O3_15700 [Burkholderiales bacterium]
MKHCQVQPSHPLRHLIQRLSIGSWFGRAALVWALIASAGAQAGVLHIEGRWAEDGSLQVAYRPPEGVQVLQLTHKPELQVWWARNVAPADACTTLDGSTIRLAMGCRQATIKVTPGLLAANAQYEPAQPVGPGGATSGVLFHLGAYVAPLAHHGLRWVWTPPEGGHVLWQGRWLAHAMTVDLPAEAVNTALAKRDGRQGPWLQHLQADQMVYLGRAPSQAFAQGRLVADERLDDARHGVILETLNRSTTRLTDVYGVGLVGSAGVVVALSDRPGFHGDTDGARMMRLRVPQRATANDSAWLRGFVAHEAVHWWNMGRFSTDHEDPWLHEGHAEWMATLLGLEQGWLTLEDVQAAVSRAVGACVDGTFNQTRAEMANQRGSLTYQCGLTLMLVAQARHHQRHASGEPVAQLATLHQGHPHLSRERLAAWAGQADLRDLLLSSEAPLGPGLQAQLQQLGLAEVRTLSESELSPQDSRTWLAALMRSDCQGVSFYGFDHEVRLAPNEGMQCASWPTVGALQRIEGQPVFGALVSADVALRRACTAGRVYRLGFADGSEQAVACPTSLPPAPRMQTLAIQADMLRRWLVAK